MSNLKNNLWKKVASALRESSWDEQEAEEAADIVLDTVFNHPVIAAAPELLEACKAAFYALHNGEGGAEAQSLCSAALAKVEGGGA